MFKTASRPFYKTPWFALIITVVSAALILAIIIHLVGTAVNAAQDKEVDQITEAQKSSEILEYEEDGVEYWTDTSGTEFFQSVCWMVSESDNLYQHGSEHNVGTISTDDVTVYVEADGESDEIHYVKILLESLKDKETSAAVASQAEFVAEVVDALGSDNVYQSGYEEEELVADVSEFCETAEEEDVESVELDQASIVLYMEEDVPVCEITAE